MKHIDTLRFCKENLASAGVFKPLDLPRLKAEVQPDTDFAVQWSAQGLAPDQLTLALQADLAMQCQRCLGPLQACIDVAYRFQFVKDEATAQAMDEESDEIDHLVHAKQFDLLELIEDETLMALPLVCLHEVCPTLGAAAHLPKEHKPNPFQALASLL